MPVFTKFRSIFNSSKLPFFWGGLTKTVRNHKNQSSRNHITLAKAMWLLSTLFRNSDFRWLLWSAPFAVIPRGSMYLLRHVNPSPTAEAKWGSWIDGTVFIHSFWWENCEYRESPFSRCFTSTISYFFCVESKRMPRKTRRRSNHPALSIWVIIWT